MLFKTFFRTIFAFLEAEWHRFLISILAWNTMYIWPCQPYRPCNPCMGCIIIVMAPRVNVFKGCETSCTEDHYLGHGSLCARKTPLPRSWHSTLEKLPLETVSLRNVAETLMHRFLFRLSARQGNEWSLGKDCKLARSSRVLVRRLNYPFEYLFFHVYLYQ